MLRILGKPSTLCDGLTRREVLRVGGIGLGGLSLPTLLKYRAEANGTRQGTAKSVIVLFNSGGMPHHESWDPKPEAPAEIRGEFGTIPTRVPGFYVGELMPRTAMLTDKIAVIRTMVTGDNAHSTSGYQMLTGVPHIPLNRENAGPGKPNDWPSYNAMIQALCPSVGGLPPSISLPRRMANNGGQDPWPGTDGGFLGRKFDPWLLVCDPSEENFTVPGGELLEGVLPERLDRRLELLKQFNFSDDDLGRHAAVENYDLYRNQAIELIGGGHARTAFDLRKEPDEVRDLYGRTRHGQSALLARRLVEAGVALVQVQSVSGDKKRFNGGGWDTHEKHSESLKGWLMPDMDKLYSALITDLEERGMLQETLVCWVSEFGHTPKFNKRGGRDHWGRVFSIALAGGGIRGGVIHGSSDSHAAEPLGDIVRPCDYLATIFHCLGFPEHTVVHDMLNRPFPMTNGRVIRTLV